MSDLVEKVAIAILTADGSPLDDRHKIDNCWNCKADARAAIRAVLKHYSEPGNVSRDMCLVAMERHNTVGGDWRHTIAAAMAAALKEVES